MTTAALATAQAEFEAALPQMDRVLRFHFRRWPRSYRADALAEGRAAIWSAWCGLVRRGLDPLQVGVTGVAYNAVRYVKQGRRLGNPTKGGHGLMDVWHRRARRKFGYQIISLDSRAELASESGPATNVWKEWLAADHHPSPADQAAFRIDFGDWLSGLPARKRRIAELLAVGSTTNEVARELGVTPPAISMTRTSLAESWHEFQGEAAAARSVAAAATA